MRGSRLLRFGGAPLAVSTLVLAACGDDDGDATAATPDASPSPTAVGTDVPNPADELVEEAAPIVSVDVVSLDSAPPQYVAHVVSAQPDGCYKFARFEVETSGTTITVTVLNTRPADLTVVLCAQQYSETTSDVSLGTLESGTEYTLDVNGETQTFVAE